MVLISIFLKLIEPCYSIRAAAFGFRLDIPSGTAVRFEPGDSKDVELVALGGNRSVRGLNNLTNGTLDNSEVKDNAIANAQESGFIEQPND